MKMSWKGRTFNQIISKMKKNTNSNTSYSNIFMPSPVKQYRREIDTEDNCSRATVSLADFLKPGGTIVNSLTGAGVNTVDFNLTNDTTEKPTSLSCSIRADDARRRMRSGGMTKQFSSGGGKYYTSSAQHLENNNIGFEQNNYRTLQIGEPTFRDGIPSTVQNVYTPNGTNRFAKVRIEGFSESENPLFKYTWVDGLEYDVSIPDGDYDLENLNLHFNSVQEIRKHYLIDSHRNNTKVYFMKFVYDSASDRIQIQCSGMNSTLYSPDRYSPWTSYLITVNWKIPEYTLVPNIILLDNVFLDIIGFETLGYYPPEKINPDTFAQPETNENPINNKYNSHDKYYILGSKKPTIGTRFVPVFYKPSNSVFATQGGVSASSFVTRLRYETITKATTNYTTPLGKAVANALAYNVPAAGYSYKYSVGYSASCVPEIDKSSKIMRSCSASKIKGG
jgi:hypothetical protein